MLNAGQQAANPNSQANAFNPQPEARQQPLGPNPQILNAQGRPPLNPGGMGLSKDSNLGQNQAGRQYYPYQGQNPYGSQGLNPYGSQGLNPYGSQGYNPYGSMGGYNQYGSGQYSQYGQGMGQYNPYGNQYSGSYNRPGYSSNMYPSGGNSYGGYYWNAGQKQHVNMFSVFLSSLLALVRHKRFNKIAPFHTHTITTKGQFQSSNPFNYTISSQIKDIQSYCF
ncbi:unnamed protein product [Rotaria sordida]|uniref:Uncharacterized protein n=1 Tax=Rotaria sordida TaxID=392033 RepID=A0A818X3I1_9BILA|nr:unnamed protein product [Rotaria sordida]CAF3731713.1 unnamed protein product [Rotaria sordida]